MAFSFGINASAGGTTGASFRSKKFYDSEAAAGIISGYSAIVSSGLAITTGRCHNGNGS